MEWLLIAALLGFALFLNIKSFAGLSEIKQQRQHMIEESKTITNSMDEFVQKLEKENDELYQKLVDYIKVKESGLNNKIRVLEEQLGEFSAISPIPQEAILEKQEEENAVEEFDHSTQEQEKIAQLYKQGFSAKQIAKVLQMGQGKVELALSIYQKKKSYQK